jgi:hypothetical protein
VTLTGVAMLVPAALWAFAMKLWRSPMKQETLAAD